MYSVLVALVLAQAQQEAPQQSGEVWGMADLHVHQWMGEFGFGSQFTGGMPTGPERSALVDDPYGKHGKYGTQFFYRGVLESGMAHEVADDVRSGHPTQGISNIPGIPHFLGWPTNHSIAHEQTWEGWIRLAHEGLPFAYYCVTTNKCDGTIPEDLEAFRRSGEYSKHMESARASGWAGLNLMVVPLGGSQIGCYGVLKRLPDDLYGTSKGIPSHCLDENVIDRQYHRAIAWAEENDDWVQIVKHPDEAKKAIQAGKLAIVLSIEAADFLQSYPLEAIRLYRNANPDPTGYMADEEIAEALDGNSVDQQQFVKDAMRAWFHRYDRVATVQLIHQIDNPFVGAAVIDDVIVAGAVGRVKNAEKLHANAIYEPCGEVDDAQYCRGPAGDRMFSHAYAWAMSTRAKPGVGAAATRVDSRMDRMKRKDRIAPRKVSEEKVQTNRLGLTTHGKWLLDVLVEKGILLDASHLPDQGMKDIDEYLPKNVPMYLSHAIPRDISLIKRELSVTDHTLGVVKERKGVVGLRTQDDEFRGPSASNPNPNPFLEVLRTHRCRATTASFGAAAWHVQQMGIPIAFGSDFGGFTNHSGPAGQLQPGPEEKEQCAAAVHSIGSEVGTRGAAHVGLLPALAVEVSFAHHKATSATKASGAEPSRAGVVVPGQWKESLLPGLSNSAGAFLTMWENVPNLPQPRGGGIGANAQQTGETSTGSANMPVVADLLKLKELTLKDVCAPVADATGTGAMTSAHLQCDFDVKLPILRAIEARLPYETGAYPQLPTTIGLLLSAQTFGAYPNFSDGVRNGEQPIRHLTKRCLQQKSKGDCEEISDYNKILAKRRNRWASFSYNEDWSRVAPLKAGELMAVLKELQRVDDNDPRPASFVSADTWASQGAFLEVSNLEECLTNSDLFVNYAVPGVPGGDWFRWTTGRHHVGEISEKLQQTGNDDGNGLGVGCVTSFLRNASHSPEVFEYDGYWAERANASP